MVDIPRAPKKKRNRYIFGGAGALLVAVLTLGLARLKPAAPTVDRATLWIDTVRQGTMVRQVRGPGTLVPEQIRYISAVTPGRIEKINLLPGQKVKKETVLLEISNPDVQLQLLDSERQLSAAQAELVNLRSTLEQNRLNQLAVVAQAKAAYNDAVRTAKLNEELAAKQLASAYDLAKAKEAVEEQKVRLDVEEERLRVQTEAMQRQIAVQEAQVARLKNIVEFRRSEIEAMRIQAGADGVLAEMPMQIGQWVTPGVTLAKVVEPGRLKAVLRIPETQAKDIVLGQPASIDTRNGFIPGHVMRIDPSAQNGTVGVDVALDVAGPLPPGARPDLSVDGTIEIERLTNVLYVGLPAYGQPNSTVGLFKLNDDGEAVRVSVKLGRSSVNTIEVLGGLKKGDTVILSDMSAWDQVDRVKVK
ncbi:MAG: HlyD family efflux transporter periplasmic adaptor subunit [Gemmatimonadetes bacterium]|nr:HlyD family efflux transporter periplasmic adaptor subunit [Gemmatimonadota bacterium]